MKKRIYLDNNATTFVDPRVTEAIVQHLKNEMGNPSSVHAYGREARALLQNCRKNIAAYLDVKPQEVIFTSGGTESLNMAIRGCASSLPKGHIISSSVEHSCVHSTLLQLQSEGWNVTFLAPGGFGAVSPDSVKEAFRGDTRFIVLMAVNNETGVKTDINAVAAIAQESNIPFIVDGVALLGKESFVIPEGVSAMGFSGHKIHAPSGVGMCFVRTRLKLSPLLIGGEQEYQRRGGSENLTGIVALATAIKLLTDEGSYAIKKMASLRDKLEAGILEGVSGASVNGSGPRVCNTTNISFGHLDGEGLLAALDIAGVAVSHGSACSSGALEPSRVLLNMGLPRSAARSSLRLSLSRFTTEADVDEALAIILRVCSKMPGGAPSPKK